MAKNKIFALQLHFRETILNYIRDYRDYNLVLESLGLTT